MACNPFTSAAHDGFSPRSVGALLRCADAAHRDLDTVRELRMLNRLLAAVQAHPVVCVMTRAERHGALLRVRELAPIR